MVVDELITRIITHVLNVRAINAARSALDNTGQWVLAFWPDGRLSLGSQLALALLTEPEAQGIVTEAGANPDMARWLADLLGKPTSLAQVHIASGYEFRYLGQAQGEVMVSIKRNATQDPAGLLAGTFGLTDRESEVLLWLTRGKTNRDIAEILELSARTVNKHLEQVFHKMGVDNRTSAAVMADRQLQRG